ncbi:helix-turn-helix transcriptional regulator [Methylomonas sp. EFPC1]|uniref:helix-turn-helix domain-containing protein n=1 Tax=Methylomonas sp. EFPC1 TaxID=2812647 RepID=UPI001967CADA|nr:helix-turn-helix transcriptional regulator [Methylomonas sp. EFPC1]QSB02009.1 helix-turn-helix transcriptional regulator [Methylomonas sp. EFPC1]
MAKSDKSGEIQRLLQVLEALNETPETLADKTGLSARTINNYIWNDSPLGGPLLRALADGFAVSVDWLLTGRGSMLMADVLPSSTAKPLLPFFETVDLAMVQDFWWLAARCAEESLRQSGAVPGKDYCLLDLYQLAQPLVTAKVAAGEVVFQANEAAG